MRSALARAAAAAASALSHGAAARGSMRSVSGGAPRAGPAGALAAHGLTPEQTEFRGAPRPCGPGWRGGCAGRAATIARRPGPASARPRAPADLAAAFAAERLAPRSAEWDAASHFPLDALRDAAALGFGGVYTPEELGGAGLSRAGARCRGRAPRPPFARVPSAARVPAAAPPPLACAAALAAPRRPLRGPAVPGADAAACDPLPCRRRRHL